MNLGLTTVAELDLSANKPVIFRHMALALLCNVFSHFRLIAVELTLQLLIPYVVYVAIFITITN